MWIHILNSEISSYISKQNTFLQGRKFFDNRNFPRTRPLFSHVSHGLLNIVTVLIILFHLSCYRPKAIFFRFGNSRHNMSDVASVFKCAFIGSRDDRLMLYLVSIFFVKQHRVLVTKCILTENSFCYSFITMLKPISLNCGHSGCKKCFDEMTTSTNSLKCLICWTEFKAQTLSANVALDNITRDLPVRCLSSGCSWRGSYEDTQQHQRDCPKVEIEC